MPQNQKLKPYIDIIPVIIISTSSESVHSSCVNLKSTPVVLSVAELPLKLEFLVDCICIRAKMDVNELMAYKPSQAPKRPAPQVNHFNKFCDIFMLIISVTMP